MQFRRRGLFRPVPQGSDRRLARCWHHSVLSSLSRRGCGGLHRYVVAGADLLGLTRRRRAAEPARSAVPSRAASDAATERLLALAVEAQETVRYRPASQQALHRSQQRMAALLFVPPSAAQQHRRCQSPLLLLSAGSSAVPMGDRVLHDRVDVSATRPDRAAAVAAIVPPVWESPLGLPATSIHPVALGDRARLMATVRCAAPSSSWGDCNVSVKNCSISRLTDLNR